MIIEKEVEILLVEDNEGDIRLAKEALSTSKVKNSLNVIRDGEAAFEYLMRRGEYSNSKIPDIILLDLNLPKIHGKELLKMIKSEPELKKIPVVILTTSNDQKDISESYANHANSFITKPINWEQFIEVVKSIEDFWLTIVKLPNANSSDSNEQ